MKICPKCRGLYFDQDQKCANCNVELLDKDIFNMILDEYYQMNFSKRIANRFDSRYEIICKYQVPEIYEYNEQKSQQEYEVLQCQAKQKRIEKECTEKESHIPTCPTCGSTNIRKISITSKAVGVALLGFASKTIGKTYKCKNCGYYW